MTAPKKPAPKKTTPAKPTKAGAAKPSVKGATKKAKATKTTKGAAAAQAAIDQAKAGASKVLTPLQRFRAWSAKPEAIGELCAFIVTNGVTGHLARFCGAHGFAYQTVADWIERDKDRSGMYARAREDRSDTLAETLLELADEDCSTPVLDADGKLVGAKVDPGRVQQLRLKSENLKWAASKLKPKVYGDKLDLTAKIDTNSLSDEELGRKLAGFGISVAQVQKVAQEQAQAGGLRGGA